MSDVTLAEFLLTRIAEDEADARDPARVFAPPARVLAECEKNRRIVALHRLWRVPESNDDWLGGCMTCTNGGPVAQGWPCDTLRALALPYAEHPDFQEAWKP